MAYPDPASKSAALAARARRVLPDGGSRSSIRMKPYTLYVDEARGAEVVDVDGNRYVDFVNNYTSLIHGHAYGPVVEAVARQAARGSAYSFANESEIALAELLCARVPGFERIRFMNSGSEAVMNMIKAARAFTGRPKIAKCEGFYHGSYDFAEVSLGNGPGDRDGEDPKAKGYCAGTPESVLGEVVVLPFNEPQHSQRLLQAHADEIACVMIDTAPMRMGANLVRPDYVATLAETARRTGMLFVLDEVVSFRLGYGGSQGVLGVQPDLTALGKIIGGGLPVGAVAGGADVMDVFEELEGHGVRVPHGGTFNANPLTMVAGRAAMADMTPEAFERLNALGEQAREALRAVFRESGIPGQVSGTGSLFKLRLHEGPLTTLQDLFAAPMMPSADALRVALVDRGYFLGSGCLGCLSTATTAAHVEGLCEALRSALPAVARAA
jgi:glutamate-1-semialdehyde 2,1-aminomutase